MTQDPYDQQGQGFSQSGQFQQQFYREQTAPQPAPKPGFIESILGTTMTNRLKSPIAMTALILVAGAGIASLIVGSYPSGTSPQDTQIPVIRAEAGPIKFAPEELAGRDLGQESTVYDVMRSAGSAVSDGERRRQIENLLGEVQNKAESSLQSAGQAAQQQASAVLDITEDIQALQAMNPAGGVSRSQKPEGSVMAKSAPEPVVEEEVIASVDVQPPSDNILTVAPTPPSPDKPNRKPVSQRVVSQAPAPQAITQAARAPKAAVNEAQRQERELFVSSGHDGLMPFNTKAKTAQAQPQQPQKIHVPGTSPDTLAFVRSVLDKKDSRTQVKSEPAARAGSRQAANASLSSPQLSDIAPAAGTPANAKTGSYYIQLGSVRDPSGAKSEWGKLQGKFPSALTGLGHRIEEANLGDRGTFYRIQAGPVSKSDAQSRCDEIKSIKPGGCLVVR